MDSNRGQFTDSTYTTRGRIFSRGRFFRTEVGCPETKTDPMSRSPLDLLSTLVERVSTMCRSTHGPIVYRHSTDMSIACQPHSIDMSVECRSLASIATRPQVPLIHMIPRYCAVLCCARYYASFCIQRLTHLVCLPAHASLFNGARFNFL